MSHLLNVCESHGGTWVVVHSEASHKCPVCEIERRLEAGDAAILEVDELKDQIKELEEKVEQLEEARDA